jgi:lipid A disaccharide synthetase
MTKTIKEGDIRKALKARVEVYGGEIRAVSWLGRSNAPDVLALFPTDSRYYQKIGAFPPYMHPFVETKRPGKAATEAQAREHERMREAGCVVLVITTIEELDAWLPPL